MKIRVLRVSDHRANVECIEGCCVSPMREITLNGRKLVSHLEKSAKGLYVISDRHPESDKYMRISTPSMYTNEVMLLMVYMADVDFYDKPRPVPVYTVKLERFVEFEMDLHANEVTARKKEMAVLREFRR